MPNGLTSLPRAGHRIVGGGLDATVRVTTDYPALMSTFEVVVPPGYDVGAHLHHVGEEIFYVAEGELDLFAFEPVDRTVADWHQWRSESGEAPIHGGPGTFMFVPEGCPHAFGNSTEQPTRFFFQSSVPGGHENYFEELAALLRRTGGKPDPAAAEELRRRWHIEQLTNIQGGRTEAVAT